MIKWFLRQVVEAFGEYKQSPKDRVGLPVEAQNYIDNRIREAVDRINEQTDRRLREIVREKLRFWERLQFWIAVVGAMLGVFSIFGLKEFLRKRVESTTLDYLTTNIVHQAMTAVFRSNVTHFTQTELKPLNEQILELESRVAIAISNISAQQVHLSERQRLISEQQRVQELIVGAKGTGRLSDYEELLMLAKQTNQIATLASAAVTDIDLFFDAYRFRDFVRRVPVDKTTRKPLDVSTEEMIFESLVNPNWTQRETAVLRLATTKKTNTVSYLCEALFIETNLFVISQITKALTEFTDGYFAPLQVERVREWWEENKNEPRYQSPLAAFKPYYTYILVSPNRAPEAISVVGKILESEPTALKVRCFRAGCYIRLGKYDLAEKDLLEVERLNANYRLRWYYLAFLYSNQGKVNECVESLNRLIAVAPGFATDNSFLNVFPPAVIAHPALKLAR